MKISDLTPELLNHIEESSIWRPASVEQEPYTKLTQWRVYNVTYNGKIKTHFSGYAGYEGRVCSAIQSYDKNTRRGITESGRVYELVGDPGFNKDAVYVFGNWCARFPEDTEFEDITDTWA